MAPSLRLVIVALVASASAFAPPTRARTTVLAVTASDSEAIDFGTERTFVESIKYTYSLFQKSKAEGSDFKQAIADALAGDYDADLVKAELLALTKSAPCVVFTWQSSPFSKKALKYLDVAGAEVVNVRLDDPWSSGNPLRAELGRLIGRTSVPSVWIGGEYVGGFDGGVDESRPGILDLAFQGKLLPKLTAANALKASPKLEVANAPEAACVEPACTDPTHDHKAAEAACVEPACTNPTHVHKDDAAPAEPRQKSSSGW